jgi:putative hemolysin
MTLIIIEIIGILLLLVANGVFAMTEIAVVSARKSRLRRLADEGDDRARLALDLVHSPNCFLSTVQIGITLVGVMAGAFGGATIAEKIRDALRPVPVLAPYGEAIGLTLVVVAITYFSLVLGELVPKRIGLNNPERISMAMARPMHRLSVIAGPVVNFLSTSTDALLWVLGFKPAKNATITEDEIKVLVREGLRSGVFQKAETDMVESVLMLDTLTVREIMTPRAKILFLKTNDSHETAWQKIVASAHSNFPVYEGNRDNVVGIISVKAIYANLAVGTPTRIRDLMTKPLIVPVTQAVIQLLETFKQTGKHIALVTDEFGGIVGLATLNDVMEAIVGDFPSPEERLRPKAKQRDDGSWLVDAMIEIEKLEKILPGLTFGDEESKDYQTLAGFAVKTLGHVPKEGETFESQGYIFEILDMDRHRVDKVLVTSARDGGDDQKKPSTGTSA